MCIPRDYYCDHPPLRAHTHTHGVTNLLVLSILVAFEHCVFACGDAWPLCATNIFTDSYGIEGHTATMHSVCVRYSVKIHLNIACLRVGDAWPLFATNIFTDKYEMTGHTETILAVCVHEGICRKKVIRIATRKHAMFKYKRNRL